MSNLSKFEQQFYEALRDLFVGAKIEGESGYVNLMRIKSHYFEQGVLPHLQQDIDKALQPFPEFRTELFEKLYTFFKRYFNESGSIYFSDTAFQHSIYDRVYTNERDVALHYKTHMLYYVKTDRIFKSVRVEVDSVAFYFDANKVEHKRANEKRELVFNFRECSEDGTLIFDVSYSERGTKTNTEEILKTLHKKHVEVKEEILERAFRTFEKQSEVDYFINKDAQAFLREQFDLWMYQYLFSGQNVWDEKRIRQLQTLKVIAFKVIDFIAQFEDELVKIWNKPKFVLNSHYVLTLDRLFALEGGIELWEQIKVHPNFPEQVQEWRELGMVNEKFEPSLVTSPEQLGETLHSRYRYLPLDTKYFPDLEMEIISRFDHLDQQLDGWLIHSENYQALNTILPKFRELIKIVYIDPPYNTGSDEFIYRDNYQHSNWLTMMENRLWFNKSLLSLSGLVFTNIDEREQTRLELLYEQIFGSNNSLGPFIWFARAGKAVTERKLQISNEYVLCMCKSLFEAKLKLVENKVTNGRYSDKKGRYNRELLRQWGGQHDRREDRPTMHFPIPTPYGIEVYPKRSDGSDGCWRASREQVEKLLQDDDIEFVRDDSFGEINVYRKIREGTITFSAPSNILHDCGTSATATKEIKALFNEKIFDNAKPVSLVKKCISLVENNKSDIMLDFFAGSGTTAHAVMNLNLEDGGRRKYILVEMGEHFNSIILPRIKKIAFSDQWREGKALPEGVGISHFVKYYSLEQYEDALRRTHYEDADLFFDPNEDPYHAYVFRRDLKMLDSLEIKDKNTVAFHPEKLYTGIDLAETLSNLSGKWIRRLSADSVEFEDGEQVDLTNPEWRRFKPLIWW